MNLKILKQRRKKSEENKGNDGVWYKTGGYKNGAAGFGAEKIRQHRAYGMRDGAAQTDA